jgi:very-short-patch-repair endonuclease
VPLNKNLVQRSRQLRKKQTPEEQQLWRILRDRRFEGYKFRRQYVIGAFIADFCCIEKELVVELDGGGHSEGIQRQKDESKDFYLKEQGYKILRFWNNEVKRSKDAVLETILHSLSPSPRPSPSRERV